MLESSKEDLIENREPMRVAFSYGEQTIDPSGLLFYSTRSGELMRYSMNLIMCHLPIMFLEEGYKDVLILHKIAFVLRPINQL